MRNLRTEDEIIANWEGDIDKPVVSICCITYNHELYIEDALVGFLIQETDFPFEILIHDDASTDKTTDIIRKYQAKYPLLIKPIYQTENQFSKGIKISAKFNFPRAKGKYIAMCEGDDYWIAPKKLQVQKEYLERNKAFSFCFHKVKEIDETSIFKAYSAYAPINKNIFNAKDVILNHFIPTLSLFFRRDLIMKYLDAFKGEFVSGDIFIEVLLAVQGNGFCFENDMGVYRHHDGGITKGNLSFEKTLQNSKSYESLYNVLFTLTPNEYNKHIKLIKVLRVEYPLFRHHVKKREIFQSIIIFLNATKQSPLWWCALWIRKINKGFL